LQQQTIANGKCSSGKCTNLMPTPRRPAGKIDRTNFGSAGSVLIPVHGRKNISQLND
jgi:hypothetical protein